MRLVRELRRRKGRFSAGGQPWGGEGGGEGEDDEDDEDDCTDEDDDDEAEDDADDEHPDCRQRAANVRALYADAQASRSLLQRTRNARALRSPRRHCAQCGTNTALTRRTTGAVHY
jgi:hypothetical protein